MDSVSNQNMKTPLGAKPISALEYETQFERKRRERKEKELLSTTPSSSETIIEKRSEGKTKEALDLHQITIPETESLAHVNAWQDPASGTHVSIGPGSITYDPSITHKQGGDTTTTKLSPNTETRLQRRRRLKKVNEGFIVTTNGEIIESIEHADAVLAEASTIRFKTKRFLRKIDQASIIFLTCAGYYFFMGILARSVGEDDMRWYHYVILIPSGIIGLSTQIYMGKYIESKLREWGMYKDKAENVSIFLILGFLLLWKYMFL